MTLFTFQIPGRKYFSQNIVPDVYKRCKNIIFSKVESAEKLAATTDIWKEKHGKVPFISCTVQWIDENFDLLDFVLNSKHFPGSHTGELICEMLLNILADWKIEKSRIHLMLRDSGPNIVKGVGETEIPNESCFLHTLQLSIEDAIDSQRSVHDMIAVSRKIVTHFNHSAVAFQKLEDAQVQLGLASKKLMQDVPTRWNSTFYMLQSILEQKRSLHLMAAESGSGFINLDKNQWELLESTLALLEPFEEITKIISAGWSCISEVVPYVALLKKYLEKDNELHRFVGTMKSELRKSISGRFDHKLHEEWYTVATFLDPRFKLKIFPDDLKASIKATVIDKISPLHIPQDNEANNPRSSAQPVQKTLQEKIHSSLWDCFSEISGEKASENTKSRTIPEHEVEIGLYLSMGLLGRKENPLKWWKTNKSVFPNLQKLARVYLCAPSSSVYSERLFSEAGNIHLPKRNRLLPGNGEMLLFLHHNLKRIDFKY